MDEEKKKKIFIVVVAAILIAVVAIALLLSYIGSQKQKVNEQQAAQKLVELQHPAPQPTMVLVGTVVAAANSMVAFTTNDPKDYLPHADGTPNATVRRIALVTKATTFETLLMSKYDASGKPTSQPLKLSSLKAGDAVRVTADHDILNELQISATSIQKLVY